MKTKTDSNQANHKDLIKKLDKKSNEAAQWFAKSKLSRLDREAIWCSVVQRLENMDKKILSWFMAMTTTFTLLVAAGLEYANDFDFLQPFQNATTIKTDNSNLKERASKVTTEYHKRTSVLSELTLNTQHLNDLTPNDIQPINIVTENNTLIQPRTSQLNTSIQSQQWFHIFGGIKHIQNQFTPEIGIDANLYQWKKRDRIHTFSLGYSTQYDRFSNTEINGSINSQLSHFINVGYSFSNINNKGWSVNAGYMINPDSNIYKNHTIKVSTHRKLNKHLKIGTEIIFTNNLGKVLPAISLILSS